MSPEPQNSPEARPLVGLERLAGLGDRLREHEPLSAHCSLRIGGPARVWVECETAAELRTVLDVAQDSELPFEVVGLGSNTLFSDDGFDGILIRLTGELAGWSIEADGDSARVTVGAGAVNAHLVRALHRQGLTGAEFLALIPGTFGGSVAMNAGTREMELSSILQEVTILEQGPPRMERTMASQKLDMAYRHTNLPAGSVVLCGVVEVKRGDVEEAKERVRTDKEGRNRTQPYRLASVGSTFANPEGDFAGRLIEAVGLKGFALGGARISPLHANFFINEGGASAADFLRLMATARVKVRRAFGVELRPEVRFVGFDGWQRLREMEHDLELSC